MELIAAIGGSWVVKKVFGPTLDQIGDDIRGRYSEQRTQRAQRIVGIASEKLGDSVDESQAIPPRIVLKVLDEGSWSDAAISAEYFGGVLAASRTSDLDDDRGIVWASVLSRLSTYDLTLHYLIYDSFRRIHLGHRDLNVRYETQLRTHVLFIPYQSLGRLPGVGHIVTDPGPMMRSLSREKLVGDTWLYGPMDSVRSLFPPIRDLEGTDQIGGLALQLSPGGIELFMWAHGHPNTLMGVFNPELDCEPVEELPRTDRAFCSRKCEEQEIEAEEKSTPDVSDDS